MVFPVRWRTGKPFRASLQGLMWSGNAADGQYIVFAYWLDQAGDGRRHADASRSGAW